MMFAILDFQAGKKGVVLRISASNLSVPCVFFIGVSREAKKHIKTSTASKGDLQLFIQLALGEAFDPSQPPELAVPRALSCILKQDVAKAQADQWLRRSNSGAPYFVSPELEEELLAVGKVSSDLA